MKHGVMKQAAIGLALVAAGLTGGAAWANVEHATPQQAVAMVQKARAYIKANGPAKAYAAIDNRHGPFVNGEQYVVVYRRDGVVLAHGGNIKMVGHNMLDLRDADGKPFVRERMQLAKTKAAFWEDYKWTNPVTHTIEPKSMYCERLSDTLVCSGIYK